MSTLTDNDLKEIKDLIKEQNAKLEKIDDKIDQLKDNVNEQFLQVKVSLAKLEEGQNGLSKRLENLEFISRSVISGLILTLLLGLAKLLFPNLLT
jgi:DNA-binding transcriptional MerR regulator